MKKLFIVILAVLISAAALCSCGSDELGPETDLTSKVGSDENQTYNFTNGETELPDTYTAYKTSAQGFSFDILRTMYKKNRNAFYSPAGLFGQLSLMENAAAGSSLTQLKTLVNKSLSVDELNYSSGYFYSRLASLSDSAENASAEIKSAFYFNDGIPVGQEFTRRNANYYSQGLFRLDYSDSATLDKINSYISSQSGGMFDSLMPSLDSKKGIDLSSTVRFSDDWLAGFKGENVFSAPFKGSAATKKTAFLSGTEYYLKSKGCTGFIKDFKNTPCKFVAILPDGDIDTLIKKINYTTYEQLIDSMDIMTTCSVSLPAFSREFSGDLSDAVKDSGVTNIFNSKANFNSLSYGCKAKVGRIMQGAKLSITASGTNDGEPVISQYEKPEPKHEVKLDRPFIYMVVDNESYIPILMGVVSDI